MTKKDMKQNWMMTEDGLITDSYLWHQDAKRYYIKDPIDGGRILRNESRRQLQNWCEKHCEDRYWIGMGFGQFKSEKDAALFLLRWG